jgi:ABC-type sulfate/molybdate transport systems ATPase subunit
VADLFLRELRVARDSVCVLDGASAVFPKGLRTVLWGRSGAGKSTLLAAVAGLLAPLSGTIALGSRALFSSETGIDVPPHERSVGFVFQDLALWPHLTALDQVRVGGRAAGVDRAAALSLLESVGLAELASRRPGQLSGGEQQRLAIARALAGKPAMLLLDEPFSSVDGETRRSLRALLREVSPRIQGPTIYVTHDAADASSLAEGVVTLEGGMLRADERPWERGRQE